MKCSDVMERLHELCPEVYAEEWDNVGFLVGDKNQAIEKIMIALDATDEVIEEAVKSRADMLITHHPMIFSSMKRVVSSDMTGRRVIKLIQNGIAYCAMHTNFDICCMADDAADILGMKAGEPLSVTAQREGVDVGIGKVSDMDERTIKELAVLVKKLFGLDYTIVYGDENSMAKRVAVSPGSGKSMISDAVNKGADVLITGDIGHHDAIDAMAQGLSIIDAGHYGLEHIFIEYMKDYLEKCCDNVEILTYLAGCPGKVV